MRLALIILLTLVTSGCALWRKDRAEPVESGPRQEKAEPVLKPSEALKPDALDIASPITDRFYMRGIYFAPSVTTELRLDSGNAGGTDEGTLVSGEDDLGLDDQVDQGRVEFDLRLAERGHMRIDYFKLNRFSQQPLPRDIEFGDFTFEEGDTFRTKLDWRVLSLTYTYSLLKFERFEAGLGLGIHIIEAQAEGGEPGTLNREEASEVGIFPTLAVNAAWRITNRFAFTVRGQSYSASPEDFTGSMTDVHADLQFRWRRNLAFGLGYTMLKTELEVTNTDSPLLFNLDTSGPELFFRVSF